MVLTFVILQWWMLFYVQSESMGIGCTMICAFFCECLFIIFTLRNSKKICSTLNVVFDQFESSWYILEVKYKNTERATLKSNGAKPWKKKIKWNKENQAKLRKLIFENILFFMQLFRNHLTVFSLNTYNIFMITYLN